MGDSVFPLGDAQPTVEAISAFFQAYLEILESHYGFPAKKLSDLQLEELKNLLDAMLLAPDASPLSVHDKAGFRQLRRWFDLGWLP